MKKFLLTTLVCLPLLSGCATTGGVDQAKLDEIIAKVQSYTQTACNFLPTAAGVAEVIGAFSGTPGVGVAVSAVGNAICSGFQTRSATLGGTVVRNVNTPRGIIQVTGTRVK